MHPNTNTVYRYEFLVNGEVHETGFYNYTGLSKNGRWYRFKNTESGSVHLVEKHCFPVHSWVMNKQVQAKSIFHI